VRRLVPLLALALIAVPVAFAGPPRVLRRAVAADASPKSAPLTEFWDLYLSRPGTRQFAELGIEFHHQVNNGSAYAWASFGWYRWASRGPRLAIIGTNRVDVQVPQSEPGLDLRDDDGHHVSLVYASGRWTLDALLQTARVHLVLTAPHAGETALRWPIGTETHPGQPTQVATFNWSSVVGLARADGRMTEGAPLWRISGWRASLTHIWASWGFDDDLMQHLDQVVIHDHSGAWFVEGYERGEGASSQSVHDALWSGVLAHVTASGVTACRARVHRTHIVWAYDGILSFRYPTALAASCNGLHMAVRRVKSMSGSNGLVRLFARSSNGGYGTFQEQTWVP
jgi:hypothetical protein